MTLLQLLELAGETVAAWGGRHPIWTTLAIIGATVGSTVTVKKMELPVYKWARDWISPGRPISQPPARRAMEVKC